MTRTLANRFFARLDAAGRSVVDIFPQDRLRSGVYILDRLGSIHVYMYRRVVFFCEEHKSFDILLTRVRTLFDTETKRMKIMKEHADIEITSSGDNEEEREEGLFMGKIWKKVAAFIAIAVFAATILTISLFVFRSDKGNEESPSQVEIDNIMTTNLFESLMKSGDRHLGERYLGENITSFLSETTQMRSVDFDSSANLELVHGIVTNPDVLVIRVNGNIPSLYENNGNIGGEAVMIIFTQNEKLQIVLELKTTDADTVSSLITEPNTTHAYHQLKFARDNPVSLILSTINEDVSKFELGETCGSTSKQSRGLNICAKLLATSNVTSVVQDAYDFTGQDSSEEHDRTLIGTLRPVVKLESRSEHWDELSLSEYVWVYVFNFFKLSFSSLTHPNTPHTHPTHTTLH